MEKLNDEKMNIVERKAIEIGSKVTVLLMFSESDAEELYVTISKDATSSLMDGIVSVFSPLGKCIMGKSVGDVSSYPLKDKSVKVKIISIE